MGLGMPPCKMIDGVFPIVVLMKKLLSVCSQEGGVSATARSAPELETHELENENQMDSQLGKPNNN